MGKNVQELAVGFNTDYGGNWILVHHIFVATMILVMDYCNHRDDSQADICREENLSCYRILERYREERTVARTDLGQLKSIMNKWIRKSDGRVSLPDALSSAGYPQNAAWLGGDRGHNS